MSNVQSYNALIDRFHAFASGHFILKRFSHGQIEVSDLEKFGEYPFMHVIPSNVTYSQGMKTFSFQIVLADLPRDKEDKSEYQREALSDLQRIAEDLIAEITNHRVLFGDLITVNNVSLEPFLEEFQHTLTGWTVSLDLLVPYYWDACSIPAEWNDFFESGSGGTGSILTFIDSITRDENGNVSLVNDEAEPSPNYYYGTNDEGVRGWYLLTDEVGLTCVTLPSCQTIIDIEAAIDDLQEEILLKANTADISAVGFSNDYDDLDNKPTIPAAQVNSDWNATSGVAEILNKPTIPTATSDLTNDGEDGVNPFITAQDLPSLTGYVPYTGATQNVDLGTHTLSAKDLVINHSSGSGVAASITKGGAGEALTVNKTSGSGNAMSVTGGVTQLSELHLTTDLADAYIASAATWNAKFNLPSLTSGSVLFSNGTTIAQDNANLFWDDTNNRLGIGTNAPADLLTINANAANARIRYNNSDSVQWTAGNISSDNSFRIGSSTGFQFAIFQATGNVLLQNAGTFTDAGFKLDVAGTARIQNQFSATGSISAASAIARGTFLNQTLVATANNDVLVGLDIQPTFTTGAFTGTTSAALRVNGNIIPTTGGGASLGTAGLPFNNGLFLGTVFSNNIQAYSSHLNFVTTSFTTVGRFFSGTGNLTLQSGGTFTDAGFRLDVNGTARVQGSVTFGNGTDSVIRANSASVGNFNTIQLIANTSNNSTMFEVRPNGTSTDLTGFLLRDSATAAANSNVVIIGRGNATLPSTGVSYYGTLVANNVNANSLHLGFLISNVTSGRIEVARIWNSGNFALQNGGTFTDIPSARLAVNSTTQGFLPPRMTTTEKNAIASPATGLVVYDTTLGKLCVRGASAWETITSV